MQHISLYLKGSPADILRALLWEAYKRGEISREDFAARSAEINLSKK